MQCWCGPVLPGRRDDECTPRSALNPHTINQIGDFNHFSDYVFKQRSLWHFGQDSSRDSLESSVCLSDSSVTNGLITGCELLEFWLDIINCTHRCIQRTWSDGRILTGKVPQCGIHNVDSTCPCWLNTVKRDHSKSSAQFRKKLLQIVFRGWLLRLY